MTTPSIKSLNLSSNEHLSSILDYADAFARDLDYQVFDWDFCGFNDVLDVYFYRDCRLSESFIAHIYADAINDQLTHEGVYDGSLMALAECSEYIDEVIELFGTLTPDTQSLIYSALSKDVEFKGLYNQLLESYNCTK